MLADISGIIYNVSREKSINPKLKFILEYISGGNKYQSKIQIELPVHLFVFQTATEYLLLLKDPVFTYKLQSLPSHHIGSWIITLEGFLVGKSLSPRLRLKLTI